MFANSNGSFLDEKMEQIIREIGNEVTRLKFQSINIEEQRQISRIAAGLLPVTICNIFSEYVATKQQEQNKHPSVKFSLFSCHDSNILALLSFFGFRNMPLPEFTAHMIFELHNIEGKWIVRIKYEPTPSDLRFPSQLKNLKLPKGTDIIEYNNVTEGEQTLDEFIDTITYRNAIKTLEEWKQVAEYTVPDKKLSESSISIHNSE